MNRTNWKYQIDNIKEVIYLLLPKNKKEIIILFLLMLFYLSFSIYLALNTSILDSTKILVDGYFSFDNVYILHIGVENIEGHPLLLFFTLPVVYIGSFLVGIFHTYKIKTIIIVIYCCLLISFSIVYIYRYLIEIIKLKYRTSYIITLLYSLTSTQLILCFTFESFTITAFFLNYYIYYFSYKIKNNSPITLIPYLGLSLTLGGITITNIIKGLLPILFTKGGLKNNLKKFLITSFCFLLILLLIEYRYQIIEKIFNRYEAYATLNGSFYELAIDSLWGATILFPTLTSVVHPSWNTDVIMTGFYHSCWQYIVIGVLSFLLIVSIYKNYKNKLIQILLLFVSIDLILHILLQYGINNPFIYSSHWLFIIPILLGWLCKSFEHNSKFSLGLNITISCLLLVITINNLYILSQFIELAFKYFPVENLNSIPWIPPNR